jgi:hypothetical protein
MDDKIKIVITSKTDNIALDKIEGIEYVEIINNITPLTKLYNQEIEKSKTYDYLIFMHGDVNVDLTHMIEHIKQCSSKYDVMGLCGCQKLNTSYSPLNWFTGSSHFPDGRYGCVTHSEDNSGTSFFNYKHPNVTDIPVSCIDGLCIIFTRNALMSGMMFDDNFKFDFYDTDISFSTILKYKLKLGVIIEKSLHHYSLGKSILTENFLKQEIIFRQKWNLNFPPNSKISSMISG